MNSESFFKKLAAKYSTPEKVQKFIKSIPYNKEEKGETLRSARQSLNHKKAHCLEAAFLAAAILEQKGYAPFVMSLESIDNLDHVIFVYKKNNKWGSVGRSRDEGLHGRKAIYRSLRDLALSYYEPYIDNTGCITGYQIANLDDSKSNWRAGKNNIWKCEQFLIDIKHNKIPFNKKRYVKIHRAYLAGKRAKMLHGWL